MGCSDDARGALVALTLSGVALVLGAACGDAKSAVRAREGGVPPDAGGQADATLEGECQTHQDCVDQHEAHFICRPDRTCVSLLSPDCTLVRGDDLSDDAVFIGVLAVDGAPLFGVSDLARNDFTTAVGGLPSPVSGQVRPFVLVGCSFEYGDDPLPAARYLAETIGVPAIVGPQGSQTVISVAQSVTIPAGTLLISPFAQSDLITELKDDDLVFRTSPTTKAIAPQLAAMLADLEAGLRAQGMTSDLKVALISARDAYGLALSAATIPLLRFNDGSTAEENEAKSLFLSVSYDGRAMDFETDVAERILDFAPSVVISLTPAEQRAFIAIEQTWPNTHGARPFYIMAGGFSPDSLSFVAGKPDELRGRVRFATSSDPTRPLYGRYVERVQGEFGDAPGLLAAPSTYDAAYAVALGIIAAEDAAPPTGRSIARGLRRLLGGKDVVNVEPSDIERGVAFLHDGKSIELDGVSGGLDFDVNGDVVTDGAVECLARDPTTFEVTLSFSGQSYRAESGTLEGTFECD